MNWCKRNRLISEYFLQVWFHVLLKKMEVDRSIHKYKFIQFIQGQELFYNKNCIHCTTGNNPCLPVVEYRNAIQL